MKATIKFDGQEKEVELTDEQVREFGFKENKVWKPKEGENFYYINDYNEIALCDWNDGYNNDKTLYAKGNCYQTYEEAEYERDCQLYLTRYKRRLEEHNEPIDWNNDQSKWYAVYRYKYDDIVILCECSCKRQGVLYATNYEIIEDFIAEIGEENFKKYILRVKED